MEVYLWTVVLITVYAFVCYWLPKGINKRKLFILLTSIHLIIIQGMRSISVGGDLFRYENQYYLSTMVPLDVYFEGRFEIGYQIITFLFSSIGIPFQGFIFMISLFVFTILGMFIYKYSASPWMSYLLYMLLGLFDFGFSGLRQIIAMSIILLSFSSIIQRNWKKFMVFVIIATLFHSISIIFIIVYPLINWEKLNKLYEYFYIPLIGFVLLFGSQISKLAASLFNEDYLSGIGRGDGIGGIGGTAIIIAVIFVMLYFSKYLIKDLKYSHFYRIMSIIVSISLMLQLLSSYSYYFTRTNLFMVQFIIIIIPYLYKEWRNVLVNNKYDVFYINLYFYTPFLIMFFFYYQNYLTNNPHMIVPHLFFWQ